MIIKGNIDILRTLWEMRCSVDCSLLQNIPSNVFLKNINKIICTQYKLFYIY